MKTTPETSLTYRDLHEEAAGMGLDISFFKVSGIDPDAPVKCNCNAANGHGEACDLVFALLIETKRAALMQG